MFQTYGWKARYTRDLMHYAKVFAILYENGYFWNTEPYNIMNELQARQFPTHWTEEGKKELIVSVWQKTHELAKTENKDITASLLRQAIVLLHHDFLPEMTRLNMDETLKDALSPSPPPAPTAAVQQKQTQTRASSKPSQGML